MKEGWTYKKLGEICDLYQPKTISTKEMVADGKYDVFGANGVIGKYNQYNHEQPEVLMTCRGATCGNINVSTPKSWINGNAMVIHIKDNSILDKSYLVYALSHIDKRQIITGAAQPQITRQTLSPLSISYPSLSEQQRIVSRLDAAFAHIDELKANAEKQLSEARALFQKALTKAMEPKEGWEEKKLEELCTDIVDCPHSTPRKMDHPTKYPCIRTSELKGGKIVWESMQYLDEVEYEVRTTRIKPQYNDIVYGREGTYGDAVLLPKGYFFSLGQRTMLFRPDVKYVVPKYLHYNVISSHVYEQAKAKNSGCGVGHVNVKDIKVFKIGVPPLSEQQRIVSRLDSISAHVRELEEVLQKTIVECDALKQALLRKVFE